MGELGKDTPKDIEAALHDALKEERFDTATECLIGGYGPSIYGFLFRVAQDEGLASAAFAQFCEDVWRGLPGFKGHASGRTWCFTLARNALSREARKTHRRREVRLPTERLNAVAMAVHSTTALYLRTESKTRLAELRQGLDPGDRELLALRVEQGLPWSSIAQVLSQRPLSREETKRRATALRTRFYRLKSRLKDALKSPHSSAPELP